MFLNYEPNNCNDKMRTGVYSVLVAGGSCLKNALTECGSQLPLRVRQGMQVIVTSVDFICVEQFESL